MPYLRSHRLLPAIVVTVILGWVGLLVQSFAQESRPQVTSSTILGRDYVVSQAPPIPIAPSPASNRDELDEKTKQLLQAELQRVRNGGRSWDDPTAKLLENIALGVIVLIVVAAALRFVARD